MDSIYKLMNKINDQDSLTEKYNVKDEKDLVTLHESLRKPLNESNSLYTSLGTMVLSPAKRAPIPVNSYVSIDLDNATADKMNIKIGSKAKISQLVGQVTGVYNPAGNDQEYAAMLNHLTGSNIRVSTVKDQVIYRVRMHDMFKATQGRDRDIIIPAHFVSSITEEDYIAAVNRAFPRKGLDKLVHGKDKRFNHVDSSGHTSFKKDKKNEAFDDEYDEDSFDIDKYYTRGTDKDAIAYLDDPDLAEYLYKCETVDSSFKHVCWLMAKPEYKDALEQYDLVELVEDATGEFIAIFVDDRVYDVTDEIISCLS